MASRRQSVIRMLEAPHAHSPPATDVATQSSTPILKTRSDTNRTPTTPILSLTKKRKFNKVSPPLEDNSEECGYIHYPHLLVPRKCSWKDSIRRKARFFCPEEGRESTEPWVGSGACASPERKTRMVEFCNGRDKNVGREIGMM